MQRCREQRAYRSGQRVRGTLDAAVSVQQPRRVQRVRPRPDARDDRPEAPVEQFAVGVQQHADVVARPFDARVVGRAVAGITGQRDDLGTPVGGDVHTFVARAGIHGDDLGPLGREPLERAQQHPQLRRGVVQHDDDRVWHEAAP